MLKPGKPAASLPMVICHACVPEDGREHGALQCSASRHALFGIQRAAWVLAKEVCHCLQIATTKPGVESGMSANRVLPIKHNWQSNEAVSPARMLLTHLDNVWHARGAACQLDAADLVQRHATVCQRLHRQKKRWYCPNGCVMAGMSIPSLQRENTRPQGMTCHQLQRQQLTFFSAPLGSVRRVSSGLAISSKSSRVIAPEASTSSPRLSTVMRASAFALSTFFSCRGAHTTAERLLSHARAWRLTTAVDGHAASQQQWTPNSLTKD